MEFEEAKQGAMFYAFDKGEEVKTEHILRTRRSAGREKGGKDDQSQQAIRGMKS